MAAVAKRVIGTHSGTHHVDEALAVGMLRMTTEFKDAEVVRSRDPETLDKLDILVDVGGVYDPANHRYDHHQRGFEETFDDAHATKLSSAGLIYKHFGREVVAVHTPGVEDATREIIYQKLYDNFIEYIDGQDNGVSQYDGEPKYKSNGTDLGARVARLNPSWNDVDTDSQGRFEKAVALATGEFVEVIEGYVKSWLPARAIVDAAMDGREEVDASGAILVLSYFCPFAEHVFQIEKERECEGAVKYILFEDRSGQWRIRAMPLRPGSFENRLPLPEKWRGVRDEALSELTGVPDCVFVHASGFIGGNQTKEGVLAMAKLALAESA